MVPTLATATKEEESHHQGPSRQSSKPDALQVINENGFQDLDWI
jgi:hypothetical protein